MKEIKITQEQKEKYKISRVVQYEDGHFHIWWLNGHPDGRDYKRDEVMLFLR